MPEYVSEDFDYFYGNEAERFRFYMLPEMLFRDIRFKRLSSDAKILYSLFLSRNSLSIKNNWQDDDGKTFIYYTQEEAMDNLNCKTDKIVKIFSELDKIKLIERKKQGLGKPTKIYVKKFYSDYRCYQNPHREPTDPDENEDKSSRYFLTSEKPKSGIRKNRSLDFGKTDSNYIDTKYNNQNYNKSVNLSVISKNKHNDIPLETDRLTDFKTMDYSDILFSLGYNWQEKTLKKPTDNSDFKEFDDYENIMKCSIPYHFKEDKRIMTIALKFLCSYSYYTPTMEPASTRLLNTVISTISEMACADHSMLQGHRVGYNEVIDKINDIIHTSSLMDWFFSFETAWCKILQEREENIKNQRAYLKSCIWNWMNDFEFNVDNTVRAIR